MENNLKSKSAWWKPAIIIWVKVSGWIVVPAIAALTVGNYLDNLFHKNQVFFIILMILSFALSASAITKISKQYIKQLEEESKKKNDGNK